MPPSLPANSSPLTLVLADLLAAYRADTVRDAYKKLIQRDPALKRALAPVAGHLNWGHTASGLVQKCLEQPGDSPLHQAADALLAHGLHTETVYVSQSPVPAPPRYTMQLLHSRVAPVLYGTTPEGPISIWSSDTGAHIADLNCKRGARIRELVELPDGTLRARVATGEILERAPGKDAFAVVLNMRDKGSKYGPSVVSSADLRYSLAARNPTIVEGPEGYHLEFLLHDVTTPRKPRAFNIAGSEWFGELVSLGPTTGGVIHMRTGAGEDSYTLTLVDLVTGAVIREVPILGRVDHLAPSPDGQTALACTTEGDGPSRWWRISLTDGQRTELAPDAIDKEEGRPRELLADRLSYDAREEAVRGPDGAILARYAPVGQLTATSAHPGPRPGTFIITSGGDDGTLTLIAPYDAARKAAPAAPPVALDWARPGTVLTYAISDFDADDTYTFRVVGADDGLTLAIHMLSGEEDEKPRAEQVAAALRFTAGALERATRFAGIAQGGIDVEEDAPVTDCLPPILLGRALFARLCTGVTEPFPTEWSRPEATLTGSQDTQPHSVTIDSNSSPVSARRFEGTDGTLTVLDDPRWPLVLDRTEADCYVRLTKLSLPRQEAPAKPSRARKAAAEPPASSAPSTPDAPSPAGGSTQRFEATEGGAAKFWEITVDGVEVRVRFGKLGAAGQTQSKTHPSAEQATREAARLVAEKTKKGYRPAG